jgi:ABC-2 type transport system ATP-binding protein
MASHDRAYGRTLLATMLALACWAPAAQARDAVVTSFDATPIVTHFYPGVRAAAGERLPTVLIGPGFAFRGDKAPTANGGDRIGIANLLNGAFNVLTWNPRGFGGSGGVSRFDSPAYEARDVQALVGYVAAQPEALLDGPGDPRVGMSGSSYGGGVQFVSAAIEPRIDALVADVAWHSLPDSFARDGAFKAGWILQLCANGQTFGLLDGVTDGLASPAGIQLGSVAPQFSRMCLEGSVSGALSAATRRWLASLGPGSLVERIRAPTLITHGTVDTLLPPGQAIANYDLLRKSGVPAKMLWYCGGHGTCQTPAGDAGHLGRAGMAWLRRWLKRDEKVATGPSFEWIDDAGTWRSGPDYPLAPAGSLGVSATGRLGLLPSISLTLGGKVLGTPVLSVLDARYDAPSGDVDIVGEPVLHLTYRGTAAPRATFVYAQVVDAATARVVGGQVTPVPLVLDGRRRTVTRSLETIAIRDAASDLRLRIVPSTPLYGPQRSAGTLDIRLSSTLPLVDASRAARSPRYNRARRGRGNRATRRAPRSAAFAAA